MPPRRRNTESKKKTTSVKGVIEGAGEVVEQPITDTLKKLYALCHECHYVPCHSGNRWL